MGELKRLGEGVDSRPWHARAALALVNIERTLAEDCPRCEGVASEVGCACTSRSDPTDGRELGLRRGPICRWATAEATRQARRDLETVRRDRLRSAGCIDPDALRLIPPATAPPMPELGEADLAGARLAMKSAEYYVQTETTRTLVLSGATGAGKSFAAAWAVAATPGGCCWLPATTLDSLERWRLAESRARDCALLVVDDLGREHAAESGWASEQLGNLIGGRIDAGRRTLVTTNLDGRQLVARYGARLASRLRREDAAVISIGTIDLRSRALANRRAGGELSFADRVRASP